MTKHRWLRVIPLVALVATIGVTTAQASDSTSHAAQTTSMFASDAAYCTTSVPLPNRNASNPGVTKDSITISDMSIDSAGLKRLGVDTPDYGGFMKIFIDEINRCGGINGRKLNYKADKYNPVAPDLQGHIQAMCLKATEDQKAFVVIEIGAPQGSSIQRCVSVAHKSLFNGPTGMSAADFADAKGRLFSLYPPTDKQAAGTISDLIAQNLLKGRKIGVLGQQTSASATNEQQDQYVDYLKSKGYDVTSFEVLPCIGVICSAGIPSAVNRLKAKDVDILILTGNISSTTAGPLFREMLNQSFKVPMYGPHSGALHSDNLSTSLIRNAGTDAARFASNIGWYAFNNTEVQGAWRTGQASASTLATTCNAIVGKATNSAPFVFGERDINNSRWTGTVTACIQVREIARAIESLGANVTTERMAAALKAQKEKDQTYNYKGIPNFAAAKWFTAGQLTPSKGVWVKFAYPCPLPTAASASTGCFLPVDRPARVRTIKY
ncbi:MAG: hypothetical protein JWN67_2300 [Actinomycetia bacterium]|nr:hypothetical protein [Actinomycetes bacterium]